MSNLSQRLKAHRFATLAFSMALLGILAGLVLGWSSKANSYYQGQRRTAVSPKITSMTSAIRVVSAEQTSLGDASVFAVKLQNTSDKDIKAYSIASGKTWMTSSYFLTTESFAAGAIIDQFIPVPSDASPDFKIPLNGAQFTVTAAYFADGTGDGVSLYVSRIADQHAGIRDQASRILPCLRELSSASEQGLATCEAEALRLPVEMAGKSSDYQSGLENARREILSQLNDIREKTQTANLTEAVEKQEKVTRLFQGLAGPSSKP